MIDATRFDHFSVHQPDWNEFRVIGATGEEKTTLLANLPRRELAEAIVQLLFRQCAKARLEAARQESGIDVAQFVAFWVHQPTMADSFNLIGSDGAREMILIRGIPDRELAKAMVDALYEEWAGQKLAE